MDKWRRNESTLVVSDLPIYILRQAPHVWEIEHDPIEPSFTHVFAPFMQLRRIHAIENIDVLFVLKGGNMRHRLRIFIYQSRPVVETRGHQGLAGVVHEERVCEGEITLGESESELPRLLRVLEGKGSTAHLRPQGECGAKGRKGWWEELLGRGVWKMNELDGELAGEKDKAVKLFWGSFAFLICPLALIKITII